VPHRPGRGEPLFLAPWPALLLAASLPLIFLLQTRVPDQDALLRAYGLVPAEAANGRWIGLFTSLLLHGGWGHVLLNAVGALAFGTPLARLLGLSFARGLAFFLFYLVCGVGAGWFYVLLHPTNTDTVVGASGAVSGLMGAAARLLERRGRLGPFFSPTVVGMSAAWVVANLIIGVGGIAAPGSGGAPVAWEVHIFGFFIGLLLVGPWSALFGKRWRAPLEFEDSRVDGARWPDGRPLH
jgi:membrane associated rhomboid family serine protease